MHYVWKYKMITNFRGRIKPWAWSEKIQYILHTEHTPVNGNKKSKNAMQAIFYMMGCN